MTRSSHPVSNIMHNDNALFPENDGRVACSFVFLPHDVFTSGDSVREFPGQDEVTLCRQRIPSCPSDIQGACAAMGRHEQLPSWAATSDSAPRLPRASRRRRERPTWMETCSSVFGPKTRRQPRGERPPPRGAASGDDGTRGSVLSHQSRGISPRQRACPGSAKIPPE